MRLPATLDDLVLADLERAQRLVRKVHPDPIDPQFRIATPDGDNWIGITLTENAKERARRMALVSDFMAGGPLQATEAKINDGFDLIAEALGESGMVVEQLHEAIEALFGVSALQQGLDGCNLLVLGRRAESACCEIASAVCSYKKKPAASVGCFAAGSWFARGG